MNLATVTRRLATTAMNIHAGRLLGLVAAAERKEALRAKILEQAEDLSRWANQRKGEARVALHEEIKRTDSVAAAVAAELEQLPFLDESYRQFKAE